MPDDKTKDVQLKAAMDLLHGVKVVSNAKPSQVKPKSAGGSDDDDETNAN
ncbi:hypothetical protein BH10PSE7_BH10PSE7_44940 [soil metagenome]